MNSHDLSRISDINYFTPRTRYNVVATFILSRKRLQRFQERLEIENATFKSKNTNL